ncbi:MAG: 16S rRNA (guanine(527)-N(7))-methyltransferase RsmG [Corynebacterium sp.]|nr:16S rRNA (guanine(527)-N(7))-methyltransferase RsmG [Corynebacterium sp.]
MFHVKPSNIPTPPPEVAAVFGDRSELAIAYCESLATDGHIRGFMGPREIPRLWERHILNCAVLGRAFDEGIRVADVGSGAGLPGIPLAIARPDLEFILIEPLLKRSTYLQEVKELLKLDNVTVIRGRAEEKPVRQAIGKGVDIVTSRAVAPLGKLAGWSLPLVRKGGAMMAMKGSSAQEEIDRDKDQIRAAGGGKAEIFTVGDDVLEIPTTVVKIPRVK